MKTEFEYGGIKFTPVNRKVEGAIDPQMIGPLFRGSKGKAIVKGVHNKGRQSMVALADPTDTRRTIVCAIKLNDIRLSEENLAYLKCLASRAEPVHSKVSAVQATAT